MSTPTESDYQDFADRLLRSAEAAALLGVKPQTLAVWRLRGCGPKFIRCGRGPSSPVAYRRSDLDAWLAARTFASTSEETAHRKPAA